MKKIITAVLILIVLASLAIPAASSKEYVRAADSATVSDQLKSQLDIDEEDTVIRVYRMSIKEAFTEYDTVDQALLSDSLTGVYYAVMDGEGRINYFESKNGVCRPVQSDEISIRMDLYLEGNVQIWNQIGSDAIIYYRYFIDGVDDSAVYYKTSKGDFVYYYAPKAGQHLFYLKDFIAYQIAPYPLSEIDQHYFFNENDKISENPWFFLSAGALALIAGICVAAVILYRKKFRPHIPNSQRQETLFDPDIIIGHCVSSAWAD